MVAAATHTICSWCVVLEGEAWGPVKMQAMAATHNFTLYTAPLTLATG